MKVDRNSQQSFGGGQEKQSSLYNKDKSKEEENVDEDKSNRKKVELKVRKFKKKTISEPWTFAANVWAATAVKRRNMHLYEKEASLLLNPTFVIDNFFLDGFVTSTFQIQEVREKKLWLYYFNSQTCEESRMQKDDFLFPFCTEIFEANISL